MRSFRTTTGRRVNVIGSHTNTPITPIRSFWSTLTMNFLTPRGGSCGFPSGTLRRLAAVCRQALTTREKRGRDIYTERNFVFGCAQTREVLRVWDVLFFGEPKVLAVDFGTDPAAPRRPLPVRPAPRGWLPDASWKYVPHNTVA